MTHTHHPPPESAPRGVVHKPGDHIEDVYRITRRIDAIGERAPGRLSGISWYYLKLIFLNGIGWAMDAMETLVFNYVLKDIKKDIKMSVHQTSFLLGAVFVGSFIGAFAVGSLSDKYGRRPMFLVTLMIFLAGFALCGASWNITSLTAFRIIGGIGLGGELPVVSTLVQELSPQITRGKIIVVLESFWAVGGMVAVLMAYAVEPYTGWRGMFFICCAPVVYGIVVRFAIPESPKWLASVGRYDEAVAIVEAIERAHGLTPYDETREVGKFEEPIAQVQLPESHIGRVTLLFRQPFCMRTTVLWTLWFGISMSYYAIFIRLPSLIGLKDQGFDLNSSWWSMLIIMTAQLPGYFSAAYLVEVIGRKTTLVLYLTCSFAAAIAFVYVPPHEAEILVTGSILAFFLLGAWGCVYAYTPENYPTAIRGIGAAYPSGFSRIGAFSGPYLCNDMQESWGFSLEAILWFFGGILVFIALVVLIFGYEPRGKNVENFQDEGKEKAVFREVGTPL